MKKLLLIVLFFSAVCVYSQEIEKPKIAKDKIYHVIGSFLATETFYVASRSSGDNIQNSRCNSLIFGVSVGIGKEYYDTKKKNPTGFSKMDLLADCVGIGLAMVCIHNLQK